ncbi:MAG: DUF721 domain-containing protein [Patescibacteria group bacterium]
MSNFTPIGALIDKALDRTGVRRRVEITGVLDKFNELCYEKLGDQSKGKVKAIYIKNKILTVACLNSVFAQEIQFNVHVFIKEINKEFGDVVERVRFLL